MINLSYMSLLEEQIKNIKIKEDTISNPKPEWKPPVEENNNVKSFSVTGWICPVCGRGNSPLNMTCPCVK